MVLLLNQFNRGQGSLRAVPEGNEPRRWAHTIRGPGYTRKPVSLTSSHFHPYSNTYNWSKEKMLFWSRCARTSLKTWPERPGRQRRSGCCVLNARAFGNPLVVVEVRTAPFRLCQPLRGPSKGFSSLGCPVSSHLALLLVLFLARFLCPCLCSSHQRRFCYPIAFVHAAAFAVGLLFAVNGKRSFVLFIYWDCP